MNLKKAIINGLASVAILSMMPIAAVGANGNHRAQQAQPIDVTRTIQVYPVQKTVNGPRIYLKRGANVTMSKYNRRLHGYIIKGEGRTYVARDRKTNWYKPAQQKNNQQNRQNKQTKRNQRAKLNRRAKKNVRRTRKVRKNRFKRTIKKSQRKLRRRYHVRKNRQQVLRAKYRLSNNNRLLARSGYRDLRPFGTIDVMNKYAPNDKRAVVPKRANLKKNTLWIKGYLSKRNVRKGKNPIIAKGMYRAVRGGWMKLAK